MNKTEEHIAQSGDKARQLKTQLKQSQNNLADIAQRKEAEQILIEEKERLEAIQEELLRKNRDVEENNIRLSLLMDASKSGLWTVDVVNAGTENPELSYIFSNQFRNILGFSDEHDFPNELSYWSDRLHPDDKNKAQEAYFRHLLDRSGKSHFEVEYRILKKNGEYAYIHDTCSTIRDKNGYPLHLISAIRDITELKLAEQKIIVEKERLEALGNNLPDVALFQVIEDTKIHQLYFSYVSGSWESLTGIPGDVAINDVDKVLGSVHPDDLPLVIQAIKKSVQTFSNCYVETRFIVDGRIRWLQVSASLRREGTLIFADGTMLDITHRIEAERQLIDEKNRLQLLSDNFPGGTLFQIVRHSTTRQMRILYVSATWEAVTGIDPNTILANINKLFAYIHPDDLPSFLQTIDDSVKTMNDINVKVRTGKRWLHIFSRPRLNDVGIVWDGIIIDISERKNYEMALTESEKKHKLISSNTKDVFCIIDFKTFKNTFVTGASYELFGFTNEEFLDQPIKNCIPAQYQKEFADMCKENSNKYHKTGVIENFGCEIQLYHKNRSLSWFEVSLQFVPDGKGEIFQIVGTLRNIDARKKNEAELNKYRKNLEYLVQERTDELNTTNEELVAANEELSSTNEELAVTNEELITANEELNRYKMQLEEIVEEKTKEVFMEKKFMETLIDIIPNATLLRFQLHASVESMDQLSSETVWRERLRFVNIYTHFETGGMILYSDEITSMQDVLREFDKYHPDDIVTFRANMYQSICNLSKVSFEIRYLYPENEVQWHYFVIRSYRENGNIMFDFFIIDTTKQKNNNINSEIHE